MAFTEQYQSQMNWLLQGDPSIRYQTLRDLTDADQKTVEKERAHILRQGWGKRLLDLQDKNGTWSNALYSPKWTSTFYTVLLLQRMGAPKSEQIIKACRILLERGFYKPDGGINYWKTWKQGECCVTGMLMSILCHFDIQDERIFRMIDYLFDEQMPDKGWNCERPRGAQHGSFHTTISVLEGLAAFEKKYPSDQRISIVQSKQKEAIEFLLEHHLYKSNTTWQPVNSKMIKLTFPPRWHYDIMRCLDYFQEQHIAKDERMQDAMNLLKAKQTPEGLWKLEHKYPAKIFFDMEKVGQPSRWNTLRGMRIIKFWQE